MATIITADNYQEKVTNAGVPALLDFGAEWCPHCKRIEPTVEKIAEEYAGKLVVGSIDTDNDPSLAAQFGIEYLPTFVILDAEGNVKNKVIAPANKAAIEAFIAENVTL